MQFQLTISLDNDEAAVDGVARVLPDYLAAVGARVRNGNQQGTVRDGNLITIGEWKITDQD